MLAIALAVVITVLVVRPDSGGGSSPTSATGAASEFASADDVGPVNIITEDPTCAAWGKVGDGLANEEGRFEWGQRDVELPASAWTSDHRAMYRAVSDAMSRAAEQTSILAKQTPHRVLRELFTQFAAYSREFQVSLANFSSQDAYLPEVVDGIASVIVNICASISFNSATEQAPFVQNSEAPASVARLADDVDAARFLENVDPICSDWRARFLEFDADTAQWITTSSDVASAQWTADQKVASEAATKTMNEYAVDLQNLGARSSNGILQDFANLAALYRRALAHALPAFVPTDNYLGNTSTNLVRVVNSGCKAAA